MERALLACGLTLATLVGASEARADPCGWAETGGGVVVWKQGDGAAVTATPTMSIDVGLGSDPDGPVIVGGIMRLQPYFGYGSDLAWLARLALGGFQSDWIGVAIDAGLSERLWGDKSTAFLGEVVVAGPIGLQLNVMGSYGTDYAAGFGATLGFDFARMLVGRGHLLNWWPNPQPDSVLDAPPASPSATAARF